MQKQPKTADAVFVEKYVSFCASPLRDKGEIREDLAKLIAQPMVKILAFVDETIMPSTLMVGLKTLFLRNPDTGLVHYIGNFIVYITRYRDYPEWVANFELVNLNPTYRDQTPFYHPHMREKEHSPLGKVAQICISRGRYPIFQYIRKGELHFAMELIINLLQSLGPDVAFYNIKHWPLARRQS
jgi:hypothetical protein